MQSEPCVRIVGIEVQHLADLAQPVGERVAVDRQAIGRRALGPSVFQVDAQGLAQQPAPVFPQQIADQLVDISTQGGRTPAIVEQCVCTEGHVVVEPDFWPAQEPALGEADHVAGLSRRFEELAR